MHLNEFISEGKHTCRANKTILVQNQIDSSSPAPSTIYQLISCIAPHPAPYLRMVRCRRTTSILSPGMMPGMQKNRTCTLP